MKPVTTMFTLKLSFALAAILTFGVAPATAQSARDKEDQLIATLKSEASQDKKAEACRELGRVGSQAAVPVLATLLADEKLSHMARYALEPIPSPAVDAALREALGQLKGRQLVGVIGSVGVRRDTQAIGTLGKLLADSDADVAQAAARALGRIATVEAAQAIQGALPGVPAANLLAFCEGLFRAAEQLAAQGQKAEARAIYDAIRGLKGTPHQVRAGALRGSVLIRGAEGVPLMLEAVRSDDFVLVDAAARTALEMPGAEVTQALAGELGKLSADKQILFTQTLSRRADPAAIPAVAALARKSDQRVRLAAIRALPEFASPLAVPTLEALLGESDRDLAAAAQEALAAIHGPEADAVVLAMLKSDSPAQRLTGLDLVARRRMSAAVPALLKAATDPDAKVRPAAVKRLGELCTAADIPALLSLLADAKAQPEIDAAEQALGAVAAKTDNQDATAARLNAAMGQAQPAQKRALLQVMTVLGGKGALEAVRAAVSDANPDVRSAAIRALGEWKTADAAPDLLALAQNAGGATEKTLSLRSYLGLAANPDLPADQRLSMCRQAAALCQKPEEKKKLLAALGGVQTPAALELITPHLDDAATRDEAAAAVVAIAQRLLRGREQTNNAPKVIPSLEKVVQKAPDSDVGKQARALLQKARGGSTPK